jgi:3-oxoacyl-[acyl-carrier protein] reductase
VRLDLTGRAALVTGAAHGFGRAIALGLGRCGAAVWVVDVLAGELDETAALARQEGLRCTPAVCDVTDSRPVTAVVGQMLAAEGRVDILVNNAGGVRGQTGQPVETVTDEMWEEVVKANLHSAFYCVRAAAPAMKTQRYGRIVNISSGAGRSFSLTGVQAYASSKAGQIGFTRQIAKELGAWNITVNNIAPGFVRSNPTTERQWQAMSEAGQRALVEGLALKRLGTPEDIANAVLFFVSDYAGWVTGQTLSVDGGYQMF